MIIFSFLVIYRLIHMCVICLACLVFEVCILVASVFFVSSNGNITLRGSIIPLMYSCNPKCDQINTMLDEFLKNVFLMQMYYIVSNAF